LSAVLSAIRVELESDAIFGIAEHRLSPIRSREFGRRELTDLLEETMKRNLTLLVLMCGVLVTGAFASAKQPYQAGTVVSVANHDTPSLYVGNPADAPLQSEVYSYDIGIELNCTVYMVRYETGLDYVPSVFSPNQTVQVSLEKHAMNVNLPGAREVRLSIGKRTRVKNTLCAANN
jgi:hypothetical protein